MQEEEKKEKRKKISHFLGVLTTILVIVLSIFPTLQGSNKSIFTTAYNQEQGVFSWEVGDNYTLTYLEPDKEDMFTEVTGTTTFNEVKASNHSVSYDTTYYNIGNWEVGQISANYYYSVENLDYVGFDTNTRYNGTSEDNDNHTLISTNYIMEDLFLREHNEGTQTWNFTTITENNFQYDPGQDISGTDTISSTGRTSIIKSAKISTETITIPAGTFECWKLTDYQYDEYFVNGTSVDADSNPSHSYRYSNYTTINETHTSIEYYMDNYGNVLEGSYISRCINHTTFLSKRLGIIVRFIGYEHEKENQTWTLSGYEMKSINTKHPIIPEESSSTSEESSLTTQTTDFAEITPLLLLTILGTQVLLQRKRK